MMGPIRIVEKTADVVEKVALGTVDVARDTIENIEEVPEAVEVGIERGFEIVENVVDDIFGF
jgi:transcriptional regulator